MRRGGGTHAAAGSGIGPDPRRRCAVLTKEEYRAALVRFAVETCGAVRCPSCGYPRLPGRLCATEDCPCDGALSEPVDA